MREDLRHFAQEAKRRERRAWAYLWFTSVMIVVIVVAFSLVDVVMGRA